MADPEIFVRILGPTCVEGPEGPVALAGSLPRGFLALLALDAPRPVSIDRLTSLLWGEQPPAGVKVALQQLASRVRRTLVAAGHPDALQAIAPGYALAIDPLMVDVRVFRAAARAGVSFAAAGEHERAIDEMTGALELWRGAALADLVDLPLSALLAPALDDERWRAEEQRAEAMLTIGRASEVAQLLVAATAEAPLRERLWVLRARALAAAGLPNDAVRCARSGIAVVTATLGVPPGPELATLEQSLSKHAPPSQAAVAAGAITSGGSQLLDSAFRLALDKAEQAAIAATKRAAHDEAVRHWVRSLELLDTVDHGNDRRRLRLLLGLGEARNTVGLDTDAQWVFLSASQIARSLGDGAGFAWAVLGYCSDRIAIAPPAEQAEMLVEALDGLDSGEHLLRGRLLARLATEMYWTTSPDRTLELAEQALVESSLAGDTEGRLWAWYAIAFGNWTPTRADQLLAACETYLEEAEAAGDRTHQLLAHRWLVPIVTELGDIDRGAREAAAAIELADELGLAVQQWMARVIAASQQLVVGDLDNAEALAAEALMIGTGCEPETAFDYASIFTWTVHWLRGTLNEIVTLVETVALAPGVDATRRLALAQTYGELGRIDEATAILDQLSDADLADLPHDTTWFISMASLAEAAAACDHVRAASFAMENLRPFQDRIAITSLTAVGPVAHYVGIAAWTAGHHEESIRILTEAVTFGERVGTPVFAERSRRALAARVSNFSSS